MNSIPFISHHLFVSAAGHEKRPKSRSERSPGHSKADSRRVTTPEAPTKRVEETDAPRQLELLAGVVRAG